MLSDRDWPMRGMHGRAHHAHWCKKHLHLRPYPQR